MAAGLAKAKASYYFGRNPDPMNSNLPLAASGQKNQPNSYEKGRAFEKYVIDLFNKDSFQLREWHESKKRDGSLYSADLCDPDLVMELVFSGARKYRFAVECKWRQEFRAAEFNGPLTYKSAHTWIFKAITIFQYLLL